MPSPCPQASTLARHHQLSDTNTTSPQHTSTTTQQQTLQITISSAALACLLPTQHSPTAMDFFMGIRGKDFVLVCTDTSAVHSIITIKQDEDKIIPVDSHKVFCIAGEAGDRVQFSDYIIANIKLYSLRNSTSLSTRSVANYTRGELATALRKSPYQCNLLIAGYDEGVGPSLYWLDYLATLHKVNTGGTGYGSYFALSLFDRMWHPDLTQDEAVAMMEAGIAEVKKRLVVAPPHYVLKVVDKDGVRELKTV